MNILVLQHIKIEDPGYIKDLMFADGVKLTTIELDEDEKIPNDLSKFDAMFCFFESIWCSTGNVLKTLGFKVQVQDVYKS